MTSLRNTGVPWGTLSAVGVVTAIGVAAPFTVGAVGAAIAEDLGTDTGGLGLAVAASFATMAVASRPLAALSASRDVRWVMFLACLGVTLAMSLLAVATNLLAMTVLLMGAGIAGAAAGPAVARVLAATVPVGRLALAQCVVAAGIPASSLLAGLVAGVLIEPFGWRLTVLVTALLGLLVALIVLRPLEVNQLGQPLRVSGASDSGGVPAGLLALATGLGTSAMSAVATFFGPHAAVAGLTSGTAGTILAVLALGSIATRIGAGFLLTGSPARLYRLGAGLVFGGGVGYTVMAWGGAVAFVGGAATVFGVGWAFLGVVLGATIAAADDPGAAIARVQVGLFAGPALLPLLYGPIFAAHGAAVADSLAAGLAGSAAVVLLIVAARTSRRHAELEPV